MVYRLCQRNQTAILVFADRGCPGDPEGRQTLPIAAKALSRQKRDKATGIDCPSCGKAMVERKGGSGKFLGCSGYPECRETAPIELTLKNQKKCPECGKIMTKRKSVKGPFWGCSGYPECRYTEDGKKRQPG